MINVNLLKRAAILSILIAQTAFAYTPKTQIGYASWYSYQSCRKEGTNGRFTASGARFDENANTCAIWDKKFGQILKVTNLANGTSVKVVVTDRGPAKRLARQGRIVDLSRAAFRAIADLRTGIIKVRIEEL